MTGTRIYQGWRYTFDQARPAKARWVATRGSEVLASASESAVKRLIDDGHERDSLMYRRETALA